jgi:hypothetical protein
LEARDRVRELRLDNPQATLQEIGNSCGISRERVRQILASEGLPTSARRAKIFKICKACGKKLSWRSKTGYCASCLRARITHCPAGHPYDEENTYFDARGHRKCIACLKEKHRLWEKSHHEFLVDYVRRWRRENIEKYRVYQRNYKRALRRKAGANSS